jgi:1,4-dihydroxy-2-naphthoyl-CoA hydrolase
MYTYRTRLRLRETDASGVIFFPNVFNLVQETLESFLESIGLNLGEILRAGTYHFPVVHAEADYLRAMQPGDALLITMSLISLGTTSIHLAYRFANPEGEELASARIVHVVIDPVARCKQPVPDELRRALDGLTAGRE